MRFELAPERDALAAYLGERGWLQPGESLVSAEIAGEGNMNRTVRARTDRRSLIVKQSRPWVVKYPDIPAPIERILVEARFYEITGKLPALRRFTPTLLAIDPHEHVALIEDLGAAADMTSLYAPGVRIDEAQLAELCELAHLLHGVALSDRERRSLQNTSMRALNHEHLFALPLDPDNGLDLERPTPGLTEAARRLQADDAYVARVIALGLLYQQVEGPALLHGDYYPGSFLCTDDGIKLIDPEFAFPGPPEFDLGILAAHLVFAGESDSILDRLAGHYAGRLDRSLLEGFAGVELMRRLLGVAQLPLEADLARKSAWLELSRRWVMGA